LHLTVTNTVDELKISLTTSEKMLYIIPVLLFQVKGKETDREAEKVIDDQIYLNRI